jgi:hypothetical protein
VLALRYPKLAVSCRQYVGAVISSSSNDPNIIVSVGEKEPGDVSLERLPGTIQETPMVQETL